MLLNEIHHHILFRRLAEMAVMQLTGTSSLKDVGQIAITKTQVVPKLKQVNPCCVFRTPMPENPLTEYRLILHFDVVSLLHHILYMIAFILLLLFCYFLKMQR